ncbi:hypothetical protein D3C81_490960 [compost metagenome]
MFFGAFDQLFDGRQAGQHSFAAFAQGGIEFAGKQLRQMIVQRAHVFGNRHFVIVQHHQHIRVDVPGVVHGFKRHAGGDRAVANHADRAAILAFTLRGNRHAEAGADRGRRVANRQHVIFTLSTPGKRVQAVFLADGGNPVATAGQNFMRVGLVANVPYQMIEGCVVNIVQCHRQFDGTQPGRKVAAGAADAVQQVLPQFVTQLRQALFWQRAEFIGIFH